MGTGQGTCTLCKGGMQGHGETNQDSYPIQYFLHTAKLLVASGPTVPHVTRWESPRRKGTRRCILPPSTKVFHELIRAKVVCGPHSSLHCFGVHRRHRLKCRALSPSCDAAASTVARPLPAVGSRHVAYILQQLVCWKPPAYELGKRTTECKVSVEYLRSSRVT